MFEIADRLEDVWDLWRKVLHKRVHDHPRESHGINLHHHLLRTKVVNRHDSSAARNGYLHQPPFMRVDEPVRTKDRPNRIAGIKH